MNFGGTSVALPAASDLSALGALLELLRDQKRAEEVVGKLTEAANKNEAALASLRQERAELDAAQVRANETIARERMEHTAQLDRERAAWNAERAQRLAEIEGWEKQAKELLAKTETDSRTAAQLRRDLEQRLAKLHELAV
jgi:hypothetical protein